MALTRLDRSNRDGISIRLMYGEHHRGTLLKLCNGRWSICDVRERRLHKHDFLQPTHARDKFDELFPNGVPA